MPFNAKNNEELNRAIIAYASDADLYTQEEPGEGEQELSTAEQAKVAWEAVCMKTPGMSQHATSHPSFSLMTPELAQDVLDAAEDHGIESDADGEVKTVRTSRRSADDRRKARQQKEKNEQEAGDKPADDKPADDKGDEKAQPQQSTGTASRDTSTGSAARDTNAGRNNQNNNNRNTPPGGNTRVHPVAQG